MFVCRGLTVLILKLFSWRADSFPPGLKSLWSGLGARRLLEIRSGEDEGPPQSWLWDSHWVRSRAVQPSWVGLKTQTLHLGWRCQEEFSRSKRLEIYPEWGWREERLQEDPEISASEKKQVWCRHREKSNNHLFLSLREKEGKLTRYLETEAPGKWRLGAFVICMVLGRQAGAGEMAHSGQTSAWSSCSAPLLNSTPSS